MTPTELCVRRFLDGESCAQAIFSTFTEDSGIDLDVRLRLASAFGSGARLADGTCGALVGGLMVLGLREGFASPRDVEGRRTLHGLSGRLTSAFAARHGSILCREVGGHDLSTEQGRAAAHQARVRTLRCVEVVRVSAELLATILQQPKGGG